MIDNNILAVAALSLPAAATPAAVFAAARDVLPADTSYRTGRLDNGLTYYIRRNTHEKGLADFYIIQRVGSILEEPAQRGLAHFLEHMAFNGSRHFRGSGTSPTIVHWCEKHGIKFGANLNAYTSVDETVYHVSSVPVSKAGVADTALLILSDWSNGLLLDGKEIDRERGVIHEEWRQRRAAMAAQRLMEQSLPVVYKGSKYADCMPIGSMDIVDNFKYDTLRDYYRRWYRPDLQAVVVVGDIDVDATERQVRRLFGSATVPKNAPQRTYYPVPMNGSKMTVCSLKDSEQPIMLVSLAMKREAEPDSMKNSVAHERSSFTDDLIAAMLRDRLEEMQQASPKPCLSANVKVGQFLVSRTADALTLTFGARQENVRGSFDAAVGVVERARQHGFTAGELQRAKDRLRKAALRRYNMRGDRRNAFFVGKAKDNFLNGEPLLSEQMRWQLTDGFCRNVTLDEVNRAAKEIITDSNQTLTVYAPDKPDFTVPSDADMERWVTEAQARSYEPYADVADKLALDEPSGTPGRITAEKPSVNGTTEITLSNGIKVWFRHTGFQKDIVEVKLWGEGGTSLYPADEAPTFRFITTAVEKSGVGSLDAMQLRRLLAGRQVRVTPAVGERTQQIAGTSSPADAETMFRLVNLYFTRPRFDSEAFSSETDRMRSFLTNREASPNVIYKDSLAAAVYGDDPRTRPLRLADLDRVSFVRARDIYLDRFKDATGFKMIVTGNISADSLRPLLERYIASLPAMGHGGKAGAPSAAVLPGIRHHEWRQKAKTPQSKVTVLYTWDEPFTAKNDLTLDALRRVLSIAFTDSVREEQGGVYGVSTQASVAHDDRPAASLELEFSTGPGKYAAVMPAVLRQLENIAGRGPAAADLDKVKAYLKKQYGQAVITNDYWNYVIYNRLRYGIDYDKDYLKLVDRLTADDLKKMARRIIAADRRIEVVMHTDSTGK